MLLVVLDEQPQLNSLFFFNHGLFFGLATNNIMFVLFIVFKFSFDKDHTKNMDPMGCSRGNKILNFGDVTYQRGRHEGR